MGRGGQKNSLPKSHVSSVLQVVSVSAIWEWTQQMKWNVLGVCSSVIGLCVHLHMHTVNMVSVWP